MHETVSDQVAGGAVQNDAAGLQDVGGVGRAQRFADVLLQTGTTRTHSGTSSSFPPNSVTAPVETSHA